MAELTAEERGEATRASLEKVNKIIKFCKSIGLEVTSQKTEMKIKIKKGKHKDRKISETTLEIQFEEVLNPNFTEEDATLSVEADGAD